MNYKIRKHYMGTYPEAMILNTLSVGQDDMEGLRTILIVSGIIPEDKKIGVIDHVEMYKTTTPGLYNFYIYEKVFPITAKKYIGSFADIVDAEDYMTLVNRGMVNQYHSASIFENTVSVLLNEYPNNAKTPYKTRNKITVDRRSDGSLKVYEEYKNSKIVLNTIKPTQAYAVYNVLMGFDRDKIQIPV